MPEMGDHAIPVVNVKLGGAERKLRLDFNALCRIESATGLNLLGEADFIAKLNVQHLRAIIWACLVDGPGTVEEVGAMIGVSDMPELMGGFAELWKVSVPGAADGATGGKEKGVALSQDPLPVALSGSGSGPSAVVGSGSRKRRPVVSRR